MKRRAPKDFALPMPMRGKTPDGKDVTLWHRCTQGQDHFDVDMQDLAGPVTQERFATISAAINKFTCAVEGRRLKPPPIFQ